MSTGSNHDTILLPLSIAFPHSPRSRLAPRRRLATRPRTILGPASLTAPHDPHRFALHPRPFRISADVFIACNTLAASLAYLRAFLLPAFLGTPSIHSHGRPTTPLLHHRCPTHPCLLFMAFPSTGISSHFTHDPLQGRGPYLLSPMSHRKAVFPSPTACALELRICVDPYNLLHYARIVLLPARIPTRTHTVFPTLYPPICIVIATMPSSTCPSTCTYPPCI